MSAAIYYAGPAGDLRKRKEISRGLYKVVVVNVLYSFPAVGSLITAPHEQAISEVNEQGEIYTPEGDIGAPANTGRLAEWLQRRT